MATVRVSSTEGVFWVIFITPTLFQNVSSVAKRFTPNGKVPTRFVPFPQFASVLFLNGKLFPLQDVMNTPLIHSLSLRSDATTLLAESDGKLLCPQN